jgi:hypothetical protein
MTMRGEKIYECDFDVTGLTDYGITLDAILSGKEKIPPQGLRGVSPERCVVSIICAYAPTAA